MFQHLWLSFFGCRALWQFINGVHVGGEPIQSPESERYLSWSTDRLFCSHYPQELLTNNPLPLSPLGPALHCHPGKVQDHLSGVQPARDMASPPTLMTLGPSLLPAIDSEGQGREGWRFSLIYATTQQTRCSVHLSHSHPLGRFTCIPISRVSSSVPAIGSKGTGDISP